VTGDKAVYEWSAQVLNTSESRRWDHPRRAHNSCRFLLLDIGFDGEASVRVSLGDFFGSGPGVNHNENLFFTVDTSGTALYPFHERLHEAMRCIDPDHILLLDGNRYSTEFDIFREVWPNTIYACHDYGLPGFVDGGDYPGVSRGQLIDRDVLELAFLQRTELMRQSKTPIWVGEFGPVYTGDESKDEMRYRLLVDQLEISGEHGASWSLWTYKDIGLQGLVYVDPASPYMQRVRPVLEKKARLGVDAWGSTDAGVRHIMKPIEETIRREFPDFQRFPWGQDSWVKTLVRHILFAAPLVDDFKRCFQGLRGEQVMSLVDSFRLESCIRRQRLLEILRADAGRS
jgi:endoglucanase